MKNLILIALLLIGLQSCTSDFTSNSQLSTSIELEIDQELNHLINVYDQNMKELIADNDVNGQMLFEAFKNDDFNELNSLLVDDESRSMHLDLVNYITAHYPNLETCKPCYSLENVNDDVLEEMITRLINPIVENRDDPVSECRKKCLGYYLECGSTNPGCWLAYTACVMLCNMGSDPA